MSESITHGKTYIVGRGTYQYRMDVFAAMMTKSCAELHEIVAGVHDGDAELRKGVSKLRKAELAAMCAEWETGKRENDELARSQAEAAKVTSADDILHLIDNPPTVAELNERRNADAVADQGDDIPVRPLYVRRSDSALKFRVLGIVGGLVELVAVGDSDYTMSRTFGELVRDGWVACENDGTTQFDTITLRERYSGTPARFNPEVIDEVHAVALAENARREQPTATQKLARLQAEAPRHECGLSRQGVDCMCADAAEFDVTTDDQDFNELVDGVDTAAARRERDAQTPAVPARTIKLYDRITSQAMLVLGGNAAGNLVVQYENALDDVTCTIDEKVLRCSPDFVAICDHGYTANDSCPGCDAVDERVLSLPNATVFSHGYGTRPSIFLGCIAADGNASPDRYAISPDDEIVARKCPTWADAYRALVLDHKIRVWHTAINEAQTHVTCTPVVCGTRCQGVRPCNLVDSHHDVRKANEAEAREQIATQLWSGPVSVSSSRIDDLVIGPADVWLRPDERDHGPWNPATEANEAAGLSLLWADEYHVLGQRDHESIYVHQSCEKWFPVTEFGTLGELVRAMLDHNARCEG